MHISALEEMAWSKDGLDYYSSCIPRAKERREEMSILVLEEERGSRFFWSVDSSS